MAKLCPSTRGTDVPAVLPRAKPPLPCYSRVSSLLASARPSPSRPQPRTSTLLLSRAASSFLAGHIPIIPSVPLHSSFSSHSPALVSPATHLPGPPFLGHPDKERWPKEPSREELLALDAFQLAARAENQAAKETSVEEPGSTTQSLSFWDDTMGCWVHCRRVSKSKKYYQYFENLDG